MAVSLALAKERDPALPKIRLQSLIYPALQAFDFYLPAYITHADGPGVLRKHDMVNYWLYYAFGNISFHNAFATNNHISDEFVCLFDLILYVHSTIFQLCGTCLPGLNQY